MKTKTKNQKMNFYRLSYLLIITFSLWSSVIIAQEDGSTETLFNPDAKITELLVPEIKFNSIQGDMGTLIGIYGGPMINRTLLIGACGGVNIGHPRINYGYFGGIGQLTFKAEKVVHFSTQIVIAYGTTKDYESPKSGPLDNFWNISGASFFMMEPGFNLELNINYRLILSAGVSYRYVTGLNETSDDISGTHLTNEALSGMNISLGLKFSRSKKAN